MTDVNLCELRKPAAAAEWQRYHAIRKHSLFERYLPGIVYDPDHPDERREGHHPLVLMHRGQVVGTIRIDVLDERRVCFRLVAIDEPWRGRGLGAELIRRAEQFAAARLGRTQIVLHANLNAIGFYRKQGYHETDLWEEPPFDRNSLPIGKAIGAQ